MERRTGVKSVEVGCTKKGNWCEKREKKKQKWEVRCDCKVDTERWSKYKGIRWDGISGSVGGG